MLQGYVSLYWAVSRLLEPELTQRFQSLDWSRYSTKHLFGYPTLQGEKVSLESMAKLINTFARPSTPVKWNEVDVGCKKRLTSV